MKHDSLRSIGHNIADSLASGCGLLVGLYVTDVFGEVKKSREGSITVDFLNGTIKEGAASALLKEAVSLYRDVLPSLCERHSASLSCFRELTAQYSVDAIGGQVLVTIEDANGRRSMDKYIGLPLRHIKIIDRLGRVRTSRHQL